MSPFFDFTLEQAGYRIERRDDMDLWATPEHAARDERMRELVDELPDNERLVISLMFFGAFPMSITEVAQDLKISVLKAKGRRDRGLARLAEMLTAN